jgi:hypothetical protein
MGSSITTKQSRTRTLLGIAIGIGELSHVNNAADDIALEHYAEINLPLLLII